MKEVRAAEKAVEKFEKEVERFKFLVYLVHLGNKERETLANRRRAYGQERRRVNY